MLAKQVYHTATPYIILRQRYIIEKRNALGSQKGCQGRFLVNWGLEPGVPEFTVFLLHSVQKSDIML